MKVRPSAISIVLNVVLLGGLVFVIAANREPIAAPSPASSVPTLPAPTPTPEQPHTPAPEPFQWSGLKSTDYPVFVANLRGVGCPDQTIYDIVAAEIGRVYDQKIHDLEEAHGWLDQKTIDVWRAQQAEATATAMGWPLPQRTQAAGGAPAQAPPAAPEPVAPPPRMPLALVDPSPDFFVNDRQAALLEDLRQEFIDALGDPNQDPTTPEYRERWAKAEAEANQKFKLLFGHQAVLRQQLQANQPPEE